MGQSKLKCKCDLIAQTFGESIIFNWILAYTIFKNFIFLNIIEFICLKFICGFAKCSHSHPLRGSLCQMYTVHLLLWSMLRSSAPMQPLPSRMNFFIHIFCLPSAFAVPSHIVLSYNALRGWLSHMINKSHTCFIQMMRSIIINENNKTILSIPFHIL